MRELCLIRQSPTAITDRRDGAIGLIKLVRLKLTYKQLISRKQVTHSHIELTYPFPNYILVSFVRYRGLPLPHLSTCTESVL